MIVVDTSALMAILKTEPEADRCWQRLRLESDIRISAGTLTEVMIVAARQGYTPELARLVAQVVSQVVPVTAERARRAADAYTHWGKGFHPAALNFGDCFAYATARELDCPLLYVGNDFSRTDIRNAVAD